MFCPMRHLSLLRVWPVATAPGSDSRSSAFIRGHYFCFDAIETRFKLLRKHADMRLFDNVQVIAGHSNLLESARHQVLPTFFHVVSRSQIVAGQKEGGASGINTRHII